jgi:hypothetical protein
MVNLLEKDLLSKLTFLRKVKSKAKAKIKTYEVPENSFGVEWRLNSHSIYDTGREQL